MEIKYTVQGLLIYLAIAGYLLAFVTTLLRLPRRGHLLYMIGFLISALSYAYRWYDVRHVPLQNLFEVFLCLGTLSYPLSWFCKRVLSVGGQCADMLIAAIVLIPAGFFFSAQPQHLPPALQIWLFAPHVAVYMLSYLLMAKAAFWALMQLVARRRKPVSLLAWVGMPLGAMLALLAWLFVASPQGPRGALRVFTDTFYYASCGSLFGGLLGAILGRLVQVSRDTDVPDAERATYHMVCVGFPLLTLGLVLGSWWGKLAWGDYWGWDPKELWSLASWLVYVGYFHFRYMFGKRYSGIKSAWVIAGMLTIIMTLLWVNLSKLFAGLHSYAF